jgi:hypothetical protein
LPRSEVVAVYELRVAKAMSVHAPPLESHRLHWYAYDVGLPLHDPFDPVST